MESLLEVRNLSISYRSKNGASVGAVQAATFKIEPGEIIGVLGESGSGKTTLASSLLAMFSPDARVNDGSVLLRNTELLKLRGEKLRQIRGKVVSLIYQEPGTALHPTLRAGTQIEEVLRAHTGYTADERRDAALTLLRSLFSADAERIYRSYPHQLSGGQRQRISIAQAIACKPSLLIADEPTASLDPISQRDILDLLKKLRSELQLSILFITHTPELLAAFADRILVMYAGRIVETGTATELLQSPRHPYTRALLDCRPGLNRPAIPPEGRLRVIPGEAPDLTGLPGGCAFEPRCPERIAICRQRVPRVTKLGSAQVCCFKFDAANGN